MDLLATGNTVTPGLPARTGDAANEGEKTDESATFEVFLDLALTVPSPDADMATGPEGKLPAGDVMAATICVWGKTRQMARTDTFLSRSSQSGLLSCASAGADIDSLRGFSHPSGARPSGRVRPEL